MIQNKVIPEGYRLRIHKVKAKSGKIYEYVYLVPALVRVLNVEKQMRVVVLREQGNTMQKIGDVLGISKQRVDQILKRYYKRQEKKVPA